MNWRHESLINSLVCPLRSTFLAEILRLYLEGIWNMGALGGVVFPAIALFLAEPIRRLRCFFFGVRG